ncbi:BatA domain-containing protein [Stratiformator vulcanicus]|uniref:VWFA domain-containing protein n=1 Tax=Stratiformator vulcanicus TaxID=2527980 RepID=A0A517R2L0_9PLAN|nr:BatA domain-containing protein [Stratiformator vulcanicus]QDT38126.1 hypothetical protein Pan189_25160 [Stratiformator vulcanicus]
MAWLTTFFAPFFLNPAIAATGALLIASPIIIHLINRLRFRRVRFAAMEFLLQSQQRNRRRLLIEQLLLLLLRILIVLLFAALIGRLIVDPQTLTALRQGVVTHHVVLLDDSASMRTRSVDGTAFEAAKEVLRKFLSETSSLGRSHKVTVLQMSRAADGVAVVAERSLDEALRNELDTKIENLEATYSAVRFDEAIAAATQRFAGEKTAIRRLYLLTDLRNQDWVENEAMSSALRQSAEEGIQVNVVPVVQEAGPNLGIVEIDGDLHTAAEGIPLRIRVGVKNFGQTIAENVEVAAISDGRRLPFTIRFTKIEPGETAIQETDLTPPAVGNQSLRFELESDDYPPDDARHIAMNVASDRPILLVDGNPRSDAAGLIGDVLAPIEGLSGLKPQVIGPNSIAETALSDYACVFLLDVPPLRDDAVRVLDNYVRGGGGICWFVGPSFNSDFANRYRVGLEPPETDDDGFQEFASPLFPVPLTGSRRDRKVETFDTGTAPDVTILPVSRFRLFADELAKFFGDVRIASYLAVDPDWVRDDEQRNDAVATVARLDTGDPLVLSHQIGKGRVLTVLTTADPTWNNWAKNFIYVPFIHETVKYLAERDEVDSALVGEPRVEEFSASDFGPELVVERPDGTAFTIRAIPAEGDLDEDVENSPDREIDGGELKLLSVFNAADEPGVYKIRKQTPDGAPLDAEWVAYNVALGESEVELAQPDTLRTMYEGVDEIVIHSPGDLRWLEAGQTGREIGAILIALLIAFLIAEQLLAYRLSFHPSKGGRS